MDHVVLRAIATWAQAAHRAWVPDIVPPAGLPLAAGATRLRHDCTCGGSGAWASGLIEPEPICHVLARNWRLDPTAEQRPAQVQPDKG
jgi:hypothetical protein